jgi:hypothetical protein
MAKLSKKSARRIAELVDSMVVADTIFGTAVENEDRDLARQWIQEADYCRVRLHQEFGVDVAGFESALERWNGYITA